MRTMNISLQGAFTPNPLLEQATQVALAWRAVPPTAWAAATAAARSRRRRGSSAPAALGIPAWVRQGDTVVRFGQQAIDQGCPASAHSLLAGVSQANKEEMTLAAERLQTAATARGWARLGHRAQAPGKLLSSLAEIWGVSRQGGQ